MTKITNLLTKHGLVLMYLLALTACTSSSDKGLNQGKDQNQRTTYWQIEPSFKFDTLCLLNTLTADPYYLNYYQSEYEKFEPKLTLPVKKALARLKQTVKDENRNIISAFLCLYFSATEDRTLDDMLLTIENSNTMKSRLKKTSYFSEGGWKLYESVREDLKIIFLFLKDIQIESYWAEHILPKVMQKTKEIEKDLPKYDVIAEVEHHLGFALASNTITVYMLYYSQPHGIKITGTRYLTDIAWPFKIVLRNAVHEMMHPPYDLPNDKELRKYLNLLKKDEFLMDKVLNHNPSFGYNSFEGFIEEDCVQAIEQIINEKLGIEVESRRRWKGIDDGMHVFAVALYKLMKEEHFNQKGELFRDFLIRNIRSEKLSPGKIKSIYDDFNSSSQD
jgi:hypothetical protein